MNQRVASTPISSISSSSVTKSPRRLDIEARSPPSTTWTNWSSGTSSRSGSAPAAARIALSRVDVVVVVGAEHVEEPVVAALELVPVVGDVGGEVGRLAVGAHQRAVLLVAGERRRAQPQRAVAGVGVPVGDEPLAGAVPGARLALVERRLREPAVERDAVALERRADRRHHQLDAGGGELVGRLGGGVRDLCGQLGHVLALVAVLGRLLAARAGEDRSAEALHLPAAVVEVVLALDRCCRPARGSARARRRTPRGGRRRRSAGRSGWPRRTRPGCAAGGRAGSRRTRRRRRARRRPPRGTRRRSGTGSGSPGPRPRPSRRGRRAAPAARRRAARRPRAAARPASARAASPRWSSSRRSRPASAARGSAGRPRRRRCGARRPRPAPRP